MESHDGNNGETSAEPSPPPAPPPAPPSARQSRDAALRRLLFSRRLYVTPLLVAVNVTIFCAQHFFSADGGDRFIASFGHARLAVWEGQSWRLFSALFLHGNAIHLVLNMVVLWMLGRILERVLGWHRFLAVYLISGLAGSVFFQAVADAGIGVGASGAIYGLVGVLLWIRFGFTRSGRLALTPRFVIWTLVLVVSDQLFAWLFQRGAGDGFKIATSAHLGGLAAGMFLGYFHLSALGRYSRSVAPWKRWGALGALCGVLAAVGVCAWFFPVHDPIWLVWQGLRAEEAGDERSAAALFREAREEAGAGADQLFGYILQQLLRKGEVEEAFEYWKNNPAASPLMQTELGYPIYDELMARDKPVRAREVLDDLIARTESRLQSPRADGTPAVELHNQLAWFLVLRGTRLHEALKHAEVAVRVARDLVETGVRLPSTLGGGDGRAMLAAYLNTQGWIEFHLGEEDQGLQHLVEATRLSSEGIYLLYVALAHFQLENFQAAREAARAAAKRRVGTAYEAKLLAELLTALGVDSET